MGVKVREKERGSGEYWVFVNYKGSRAAKYAGDLETALEAKQYLEKQIACGFYAPPKREEKKEAVEDPAFPTLGEYYGQFQKVYLETACRESTQERYAQCFDKYTLPRFGDMPLNGITRRMIKEFAADLVEKGFARATIRIIISNLCTVFSHAIEDGILSSNPATRMPKFFKRAKVKHESIEPLTAEEVEAFLAAAIAHDGMKRYSDVPEYYPLFLCAIHTGLRLGELAGLQWGDTDIRGKFIMVRRNIKDGRIHSTKTDKPHKVDLSDALLSELQAMKKRRLEYYLKHGRNEIPEWVFCNSDGGFLDMQNVKNRHFIKCLEAAKLRRIRFHDLRHTFASLLIQNGESLAYVKEQMGHSSIKVTVDVYGHLVPGANRQAVNRLPVPKSATQLQPAPKQEKEAV